MNSKIRVQYLESAHTCDLGTEGRGHILAIAVKKLTVSLRPNQKRRLLIRFGAAEKCLYLMVVLISLVQEGDVDPRIEEEPLIIHRVDRP